MTSPVCSNAPPPPFARRGAQLGTAAISPGQQMQLNSLPPAEYALIDFGQDNTYGKPEALEVIIWIGAAIVGTGALAAHAIPRTRPKEGVVPALEEA